MKNRWIIMFMVAILLVCMTVTAYADDKTDFSSELTVEYDGKKLTQSGELSDALNAMQPGDSLLITVSLVSNGKNDTDWWMNSKVLNSFEDSSEASGGAYTYELAFKGPGSTTPNVLYSSDTVGGEENPAGEGLHSATGALEDYFFLETLKKGDTAEVTLKVALDGETQGNAYQDTLADLQMSFAVEDRLEPGVVKTGDESNMLPYVIAAAVSGAAVLVLAILLARKGKHAQ